MTNIISFSTKNNIDQTLPQDCISLDDVTFQCRIKTSESGVLFQNYRDEFTYFLLEITTEGKIEFTSIISGELKSVKTIRGKINNDQWYCISAIIKDHEMSLFVNDKKVISEEVEGKPLPAQFIDKVFIGKEFVNNNTSNKFNGLLTDVSMWNCALSDEDIKQNKMLADFKNGLLFSLENSDVMSGGAQVSNEVDQKAVITLINDSPFDLKLSAWEEYSWPVEFDLPKVILRQSKGILSVTGGASKLDIKAKYRSSLSETSDIIITINKSSITYDSFTEVEILPLQQPAFERNITVISSDSTTFKAEIRISENLVIVNARNLNGFVESLSEKIDKEKIVKNLNYCEETGQANSDINQIIRYNQACQIFNRRLQEKPLAIVYCSNTEDVKQTYMTAKKYNLPISIRSGGHDHEGECSGTNTVLIDLIGLSDLEVTPSGLAEIGPGNRFITLTTGLAEQGVMLPHGTCATVAIPGFIMGGGWGPWTRRHGMCCEYLQKAEIVLGNGDVEIVDSNNKPELLWALKGGGGMSYGIVTKLFVQTFPLPVEMIKFELEWNLYDSISLTLTENKPTVQILTRWEEIICDINTLNLTGTNLKINGKPLDPNYCSNNVKHNCVMYGYWEGDQQSLDIFIQEEFTDQGLDPEDRRIDGIGGLGTAYGKQLMGSWDRESFQNIKLGLAGETGTPLPPDLDEPAPHKLTSRLVDCQGLGDHGHDALLKSLTSPHIISGNRELGLFSYVTLGAIDGHYYQTIPDADKDQSAFPYKDKLYTIQYQTWWNNELVQKEQLQDNEVYSRTNRALDWIEACRDFEIPNTSGAFISFKDNSIPTETYFAHNYQRLVDIKKEYSKDEYNHFRKRKTII